MALPTRVNHRCFIRKEHDCGKAFGVSKSCFIACPTDEALEPMLELLSEKLTKHGIDPVIAVKERAYGQDIFCTKICGKIIESRFCVVILDDAVADGRNIPNPNVYYEYGLMTALGKHIIPLQKDGQRLAFNIQSYDTVKYSARTMAAELERAVRDAIRATEESADPGDQGALSDKLLFRRLELAGFTSKDYNWFLNGVVEDTMFLGFGNDAEPSYLYLGKVDSDDDARTYLEDLDVVLVRTEKRATDLELKLEETKQKLTAAKARMGSRFDEGYLPYELAQARDAMPGILARLQQMRVFHIGFILAPGGVSESFRSKVEATVSAYPRFRVAFGSDGTLTLGPASIALSGTTS
jgi:hypothetical protein